MVQLVSLYATAEGRATKSVCMEAAALLKHRLGLFSIVIAEVREQTAAKFHRENLIRMILVEWENSLSSRCCDDSSRYCTYSGDMSGGDALRGRESMTVTQSDIRCTAAKKNNNGIRSRLN